VIENFLEFETIEELGEQTRADRRLLLSGGAHVKQPLSVFRLVQIFAEPPGMILHEEIELLPGGVYLGA
jgi:hypothetical protein